MLLNKETAFNSEKIQFPIDYKIKVIMEATLSDEDNEKILKEIFKQINIPNKNWTKKLSKEGKYISFTVSVHIKDQLQFNNLYKTLKEHKMIKWAV